MKLRMITAIAVMLLSAPLQAKEECGVASWYGSKFHGKQTASGEIYNMHDMTAAHKTLPFGTEVKVIDNHGNEAIVTINDRGPFIKGRIIDLSSTAALKFDMHNKGITQVCITITD